MKKLLEEVFKGQGIDTSDKEGVSAIFLLLKLQMKSHVKKYRDAYSLLIKDDGFTEEDRAILEEFNSNFDSALGSVEKVMDLFERKATENID